MTAILETIGLGQHELRILAEVVVAMALGGVIGYEREGADKPAGLRTHMLVAAAAALFVGLGTLIVPQFVEQLPNRDAVRSDPIRLFEAIITGVSFLGAGTIIFHHGTERVEGITTAASLLMTAAIGTTIGLAEWALGVTLTALVFLVLHLMARFKPHPGPDKGDRR